MLRPSSQYFSQLQEHQKYVVESSDVIEDLRVYVREEGSERVLWYKERFLTEDEIVENVVENATSKICWTIHRPKRGWYIRIRAPSFPPGVSIPLSTVPSSSPFYADAALSFSSRTNSPKRHNHPSPTATSNAKASPPPPHSSKSSVETPNSETVVHSYPPTPPPGASAASVQPPSPDSVHAKLDQLSSVRNQQSTAASEVRSFLLAPHSSPHVPQPESTSLFVKALSVFKNSKPSHSLSFTLCPLPLSADSSPSPSASTSQHQHSPSDGHSKRHSLVRLGELIPPTPSPLITFHDRTPAWSFGSTTGLLEIDMAMEKEFGVDRSFWMAVALAYMEFLVERESYLSAAGG